MSSPIPYLVRMLLFLVVVAGIGWLLHDDLIRVFLNTPTLDSVILGVLVLGIFFVFRQVIILWPEVKWLRRFQHREEGSPPPPADSVNLLAPMAAMLGERSDQIRLSPTAARAMLDGIATRLDERRELARYMIGLLIFLGLLGTFWGLLQTIGAVADAINGLQVSAGDPLTMFAKLKGSIEGPLKGMSTAFGASLFGLSGSLVLGFLELQASQAQGRFHSELEEWLARATILSSSSLPATTGAAPVPAYVEALLERNAESTDNLIRAVQKVEESRQSAAAGNAALVERLAALAETMRTQQNLLARFTELSIEMRAAVARLSDRSGAEADREALFAHQRNLEGHISRLVEETARSRGAVADELRETVAKVTDRAAADADREALLAQQRNIELQVARVAEEGEHARAQVIEELRQLAARVADRAAANADRDALMQAQQHLEGQIARLAEESARHRNDLATELQDVLTRLNDRSADVALRESLLAQQRSLESQMARMAEESARLRNDLVSELHGVADKIAGQAPGPADGEALRIHQRNVEDFLARLTEESGKVRAQISSEIEQAVARLSDKGAAEAERQSLVSHQANIEAHLARLVEENARNRAALVDELREAIGRLTERFADSDREAIANHQRNIEGHLARLAEEATLNRTALADELRGELRLLARTVAMSRGEAGLTAKSEG